MSRRWHCMNGHNGDGTLHACPDCGLPVSIRTVEDSASMIAPVAASPFPPDPTSVRDLIFSEIREPRPVIVPSLKRTPEASNGSPPSVSGIDSAGETRRPPSIDPRPAARKRDRNWVLHSTTLAALVGAAVSLGYALHLTRTNERLSDQNAVLEEKCTALEDGTSDVELQKAQSEAKRVELERSQGNLRSAVEDLQNRLADLDKPRAADTATRLEAHRDFLEAQKAAADLLDELRKPGSEGLRRNVLRRGVVLCERFAARPGDQPIGRLRAARALRLAGDLEVELERAANAIANYDAAVGFYDGLLREGGKVEGVDCRAESLDLAVRLWGALGRTNAVRAETLLRDTLARLAHLDETTRARPEYRRPHAILVGNRGLLRQMNGELAPARADYDLAIGWLADRPECALERARLLVHRASLSGRSARKDCAEAILSLRKMADPIADPPIAAEIARAHSIDAGLAVQGGEMESALQSYQNAVDLLRKLHERAPAVANYAHSLAVARGELGSHLLRMERIDLARHELETSLAALRDLAERFPDETTYRFDLGRVAASEGVALVVADELTEAVASFEAAEAIFVALSQPKRRDVRLALLGVYRNLIFCRDRQASRAIERDESRVAAKHVARLVALLGKYERTWLAATGGASRAEQARLWGERLLMRYQQVRTLRALANAHEAAGSYRGMAQAVADLRPLVAATWSGHVRTAATLMQAMVLAKADSSPLADEYADKALALLGPLAASGLPILGERLEGTAFAALKEARPAEVERLRVRWQKAQAGR